MPQRINHKREKKKNEKKKNEASSNSQQSKQNKTTVPRPPVIKNTLANPFTLDWPSLNYKHYTDIKELLKSSLSFLSEDFKRYREEKLTYRRLVRTMRRDKKASEGNKIESFEDKNKELLEQYKGSVIGHKNLVFGYNAVMRGLEKGTVVSVLVNSKAKPDFIIRMFLPICSLKSIPIIPVEDLSGVVKEINLGIKSCLALGLKRDVIMEDNAFHNLYKKTCEALEFDPLSSNEELPEKNNSAEMGVKKSPIKEVLGEKVSVKKSPIKVLGEKASSIDLSPEKINRFHLRRNNVRERVFKPNQLESKDSVSNDNLLGFNSDFIVLESVNKCPKIPEIKIKAKKKKRVKKNTTPDVDASQLSSSSMFTIDEVGDVKNVQEIKLNSIDESKISTESIALSATNVATAVDSSKMSISENLATVDSSKMTITDNVAAVESSKMTSSGNLATVDSSKFTITISDNGDVDKLTPDFVKNLENKITDKNKSDLSSDRKRTIDLASGDGLLSRKKKKGFQEFNYIPTKIKRVKNGIKKVKKKKHFNNVLMTL